MGDAWDPVDEILRHALIQSVDRQTPNPELAYPHARLGDLDRLPEATPLRAWLGQIVEREYELSGAGFPQRPGITTSWWACRFVELWANADPDLQPRVDAARARLAALGG